MKLYEVEFLNSGIKYIKLIKAKDINSVQSMAINKNWQIIDIKEYQKTKKYHLKEELFIIFFKELSILSDAGLSIQEALSELQSSHFAMKKIITKLQTHLTLGQNLSKAFENTLSNLKYNELALIKLSENTGELAQVFGRISILRQLSLDAKNNFRKTIQYPLLVFISFIAAFIFLMLFVVPNFKDLFEDLGVKLPFITELMIMIYSFLKKFLFLCLSMILCFMFLGSFLYKKIQKFALAVDFLILKIPLFSHLVLYHENYYFFMIFSSLLKSGISIAKAFELASFGIVNKALRLKFQQIGFFMDQGLILNKAFDRVCIFDKIVISMLSVAMKSAKLDFFCEEISLYYKKKEDNLSAKLLSYLEPMMTLFIALLVLFLALGIFLPMWEINSAVSF